MLTILKIKSQEQFWLRKMKLFPKYAMDAFWSSESAKNFEPILFFLHILHDCESYDFSHTASLLELFNLPVSFLHLTSSKLTPGKGLRLHIL